MPEFRVLSPLDRRRWLAASLAALSLLLWVAAAQACNVPVFRFALERWRADAYRVTIWHRAPLSAADQELLVQLEAQQDKSLANLSVRTLDIATLEDEADKALLESLGDSQFPLLTVQYPASLRIEPPVWWQPLTADATARLLESAARTQLIERLVEGETAVWLLLECGDAAKDNQAAALLEQQIDKLAQELQLPELTDQPDDNLFAKTPLKLAFSVLRVPRNESEAPLVQMLLRCESDLLERTDPMVFPVFGRGRALLPLIGAGITADNIASSATFLVGACSCEVKELNPGFDLLLTADWDRLLSADGAPLPIVATRAVPDGQPELVPIPAGGGESSRDAVAVAARAEHSSVPPHATAAPVTSSEGAIYAILALAGVLVTAGVLFRLRQVRRSTP